MTRTKRRMGEQRQRWRRPMLHYHYRYHRHPIPRPLGVDMISDLSPSVASVAVTGTVTDSVVVAVVAGSGY